MARHRKVGRPKGKTESIYGCERKITVYTRGRKGRIRKIRGYKHKSCFD